MTNASVERVLWWLGLVVAPLVLIAIELFHPSHFTFHPAPGMYEYLSKPEDYDSSYYALAYPGPQWWFLLHMIQTPMIALVAVGLWLLVAPLGDGDGWIAVALAWLSRAATMVFLIYYTALDSIGGFGMGRLILETQALGASGQLTAQQVAGVVVLLDKIWVDPWVGGVGSFVSKTGSWAVFAASVLAAAALLVTRKAPWPALILLVAFGYALQTSHASPNGPVAFVLLIVAALWMRWSARRVPVVKPA
jgi:hypothetical protein